MKAVCLPLVLILGFPAISVAQTQWDDHTIICWTDPLPCFQMDFDHIPATKQLKSMGYQGSVILSFKVDTVKPYLSDFRMIKATLYNATHTDSIIINNGNITGNRQAAISIVLPALTRYTQAIPYKIVHKQGLSCTTPIWYHLPVKIYK